MEKLNRAAKCSILGPQNLGSGGGPGPPGPPPPGSAAGTQLCSFGWLVHYVDLPAVPGCAHMIRFG